MVEFGTLNFRFSSPQLHWIIALDLSPVDLGASGTAVEAVCTPGTETVSDAPPDRPAAEMPNATAAKQTDRIIPIPSKKRVEFSALYISYQAMNYSA